MLFKRTAYALVAQLDRVFGYEPKGRGFESLQPYQLVTSDIACDELFLFPAASGRLWHPAKKLVAFCAGKRYNQPNN